MRMGSSSQHNLSKAHWEESFFKLLCLATVIWLKQAENLAVVGLNLLPLSLDRVSPGDLKNLMPGDLH